MHTKHLRMSLSQFILGQKQYAHIHVHLDSTFPCSLVLNGAPLPQVSKYTQN